MASQDLTTETGVRQYLQGKRYVCSNVERLSSGSSGFVFRATLDVSPGSIIIKHFQSYAARAPQWKLDRNRVNFEAKALGLLSKPPFLGNSAVRVPRLLDYDDTVDVVLMEDLGDLPTLKAWLQPLSSIKTCADIGRALGQFLANIHNCSADDDAVKHEFEGNETGLQLSSRLYYGRLAQVAESLGYTDDFIQEAATKGEREVLTSSEVLTLGDFWAGNLLVSLSTSDSTKNRPGHEAKLQLFAIDFEFAKPGPAAFDVGQMAAEMYFLALFRDHERGTALLEAFLKSYKDGRYIKVDAAKVAVRIGAHFVVIAPMAWQAEVGKDRVEAIQKLGLDLIRAGFERDEDALKKSVVGALYG